MRPAAVLFASALAFTTYSLYASDTAGIPSDWSLQGEAPQLYSASLDKDDTPSGKGSMVLRRTETSHPYGSALLLKSLPAADYAGKRVRVSMQIRSAGVEGSNAGIAIQDNYGFHSYTMLNQAGWQKLTRDITLPRTTDRLAIGVTLKGPGVIKVDEFDLAVLGDAPSDLNGRRIEEVKQ